MTDVRIPRGKAPSRLSKQKSTPRRIEPLAKRQLSDYPTHLRGLSNNKYGGHKATRLRTFKSDWSKTYPCRSYTKDEIRSLEAEYFKPLSS